MDLVIEPLEGAGPLKFGMSRDAIRETLEDVPYEAADDDEADGTKDAYFDGALQITYDAEDRVASIELSVHADVRPLYRDVDLFDVSPKKAIDALEKDGPFDPDVPEMPFTYIFPSLELALERPDETDEGSFERLIMGGEGFYSQREVDPESYGFGGPEANDGEAWGRDDDEDEEEDLEGEGFGTADDEDDGTDDDDDGGGLFGGGALDEDDEEDEFDDLGEEELDFDRGESSFDWGDEEDDDWLSDEDD